MSRTVPGHSGNVERRFIKLLAEVPSFGSDGVDVGVYDYIFHMANWVQGIRNWDCTRLKYVGEAGLRRTNVVELLVNVNPHTDSELILN